MRHRGRAWIFLRTGLLAVALAWALVAFGREMLTLARTQPPGPGAPPSYWSLGSPAVEPLARLLTPLDRSLPPGRRIALASDLPPSEDFFLSMWCAYLLPRHDLVRAFHQPTVPEAGILLTVGAPVAALELPGVTPRATLLTASSEGREPAVFVYRLAPPSPLPPSPASPSAP